MNLPIVSIIVPVFNASKHLIRCLNSLREQTYQRLQLVFVNDCSEDNSGDILKEFKENLKISNPSVDVLIITHSINSGVAKSRNTGLENATGDYLYYLDADDYITDTAIELLIEASLKSDCDVVGCNWVLQFEESGRTMKQPQVKYPKDAVEYMSKGTMRWNLWLFLVKRDIYTTNNIKFLPGKNMGEDMMAMFKVMMYAKKIVMLDEPLYYYCQSNQESLTKMYSQQHKQEVSDNLFEIEKYFKNHLKFNLYLNFLKLNVKLPLLISNQREKYEEWRNWFPESNTYCLKNNLISKRISLLQYMASKGQYWFVRLHYFFVIKFIYGVIYK